MQSKITPTKKTLSPYKILILGGTSDARRLATSLINSQIAVIYSIAGLVRTPDLACQIHIGGFSQYGGMQHYLKDQDIQCVLDATHPFAVNISNKAQQACSLCQTQYIRFERPQWNQYPNDKWTSIIQWSEVFGALKHQKNVFLTAGQTPHDILVKLSKQTKNLFLRTAVQPKEALPNNVNWIKAIGPFDQVSEQQWLKDNQIDLIISKNSGGQATYGKIAAARELGIDVIMFQRPAILHVPSDQSFAFNTLDQCIEHICNLNGSIYEH
ncbi:precorrin-6A reductase [Marinicellulosiphila megalodicopiae]|uniref:precorrin-6A reductase n=1 Tax=Marinicellulosiphila megalodicopiae TaxID=2724896 RepID=UPI003BAF4F19